MSPFLYTIVQMIVQSGIYTYYGDCCMPYLDDVEIHVEGGWWNGQWWRTYFDDCTHLKGFDTHPKG